jgi:putative aminopeptidase FrvX
VTLPDSLHNLLTAFGPSGVEREAAAVWQAAAKGFTDDVRGDVVGSSVARVRARPPGGGATLAIVGHIDEIGLIVTHVDDDGYLWFAGVGGWDPQILIGQRVVVKGRDGLLRGVVGKKPIHLLESEEREKSPKLKDLHIDIGAEDGDDARLNVRVGDVAVIDAEPLHLASDRWASRAMDDRLGAWVALEAARLVAEAGGAPGDVLAVASADEENGGAGALTSAFALEPDVAIVVDVTHATDAPGIDKRTQGDHGLGDGPVIERGTVMHPLVPELLIEAAEAEGIPYRLEAHGRRSGTDADSVHIARAGIPTGLIGIPLRYMHSPVEVMQLSDVGACAKLIAAFAMRLSAGVSFVR